MGQCGISSDAGAVPDHVVKMELSNKAKLWLHQLIYGPTLTCGHELWIVTERTRSRVQGAETTNDVVYKC